MERRFFIIGAGLGTAELLTSQAARLIADADLVLSTKRLAALKKDAAACPFADLAQRAISSEEQAVAILVSGDVGFFSAAKELSAKLAAYGAVELVCGISSMQYFCAKIGVPYDDVHIVSLHGRSGCLLGAVSYHQRVFALTGGAHTAQSICQELTEAGLGGITVHLGENLGAPEERIETLSAQALAQKRCGDLAVVLIEHPAAADAHAPVFDAMLVRGDTPMTKEEVRWVSVNKLKVCEGDVIWDVGAGTGSVALELARKASDGLVYAIERSAGAVALLEENRRRLGGYNVKIVAGLAPEALESLPPPHAVFVGGSGGNLRQILRVVKEKNACARVVVTAIALETQHEALTALNEIGFTQVEVVQLAAARGKKTGRYTMMTANNPVFILSGGGDA